MIETARRQGYIETMYQLNHDRYFGGGTVVAVTTIEGSLEKARLESALLDLQNFQPLLRAKVHLTNGYYFFLINRKSELLPLTFLDNQPLESILQKEMNRLFKHDEYQWRMTVMLGEAHHTILLTMAHAIGDGASVCYFFDQLLKRYAQSNEALRSEEQSLPFLPPAEELLIHREIQRVEPPKEFVRTPFPYESVVPIGSRISKMIYHAMNPEQTDAIITKCKSNGITINSLLNASLLLALAHFRQGSISTDTHTPVSLRPFCEPKIGNNYFGCYAFSKQTYHHEIGIQSSAIEVARDYQKQIKETVPNGAIIPRKFTLEEVEKSLEELVGKKKFSGGICVSNMGVLPFPARYGNLRLNSLALSASRQLGGVVILLEALTLNKQLMLSFTYVDKLLNTKSAKEIIRYFLLILENIGNQPSGV